MVIIEKRLVIYVLLFSTFWGKSGRSLRLLATVKVKIEYRNVSSESFELFDFMTHLELHDESVRNEYL